MMDVFQELKDRFFYRAIAAELFATAVFVFTIPMVVMKSVYFPNASVIDISVVCGLTVAVIIQTFGPICGAHLNPAVTIAFLIKGEISVLKSVVYILVQLIGATSGAAVAYAIIPANARGDLGVVSLNPDVTVGQGFAVEMIFTLLLVLVIFASVSSDHGRKDFGFINAAAIGLCVTVCMTIGIPFTGAGLNPARAFGPAVVMGDFTLYHWIYWIGPIFGGIIAAISYRFVLSVESKQKPVAEDEKVRNIRLTSKQLWKHLTLLNK